MSTAYDESASLSLGPNYRKLWSSSAVSNLADGIFIVALPLIAVRMTDSPLLIAGVSLAGRLPWLVFVLFAGALAERTGCPVQTGWLRRVRGGPALAGLEREARRAAVGHAFGLMF